MKNLQFKLINTISAKGFAVLASFLLNYILAKKLDLGQYGKFNFAYAIFNAGILILSLGIPQTVMQMTAGYFSRNEPSKISDIASLSIRKLLFYSVIICLILTLVIQLVQLKFSRILENFEVIQITLWTIPCAAVLFTFGELFKSIKKPVLSIFTWNLGLNIILIILILISPLDKASEILWLFYPSLLLILLFVLIIYRKNGFNLYFLKFSIESKELSQFHRAKKHFYLANIFEQVKKWGVVFIIAYLLSDQDLGLFSLALRISNLIILTLVVSNILLIPIISKNFENNKLRRLEQYIGKVMILIVSICIIFLFIIFLKSKTILQFFGNAFIDAEVPLKILSISAIIDSCFGPVALVLQICKHEKIVKFITAISASILILISLYIQDNYGIVGISIAVLVSTFIHNSLLWIYCEKKLGIKIIPRWTND